MSYHLAAYYNSALGTVANTDTPALPDGNLTIINNHFVLRKTYGLVRAFAASPTLIRARFDSPTMRFYGNPFIRPVNVGILPVNNPNEMMLSRRPFILPPGEEVAVQMTAAPGTTEKAITLIWLMSSYTAPPPGNIYRVRFTSTTAAVANAWTIAAYTMDQGIPSGVYSMVMSELQSTNAIAHRWTFNEQVDRPGVLSITSEANRDDNEDYLLPLGEMGRFVNTSLPILEVLANAADAAHVGYMYLIPIGQGAQSLQPQNQLLLPAGQVQTPVGVMPTA